MLRRLLPILILVSSLWGCSGSGGTAPPPGVPVVRVEIVAPVQAVEFPGETASLAAIAVDSKGGIVQASIRWSSSNESVATVDARGMVTARRFGSTQIRAEAGTVGATIEFEVVGDRFFLNGNVRLRYDLDLPNASGGPFPAVVWVHGAGMLDRNAQRIGSDPLVPEGVAVLRYDKRGVGQSTGSFFNIGLTNAETGLRTLASDAAAGVSFLSKLSQIDPTRIGIMANSQGGWIGPLAASESDQVRFLMMWSGPTVSVGLELFYSNLAEGTTTPLDNVYAQLPGYSGPAGYEPLPILQSLTIPSLWLLGGLDRSIPSRLDTLNIRWLQAMGLPYEFIWYPTGRHDLRDANTGQFLDVWSDFLGWMRQNGIL